MQKPAHYLPAHLNVEEDVGPIKSFIQDTNCIIMKRHGFTVLGRTVSEAYHRTCVLVSEIKRNIIVETAVRGERQDAGIRLRGGAGLHGDARRRRDVSQAGQEDGMTISVVSTGAERSEAERSNRLVQAVRGCH